MSRLTFRLTCVALAIAGTLILVAWVHGRHRPPHDDGTYPKIPSTDSTTVAR